MSDRRPTGRTLLLASAPSHSFKMFKNTFQSGFLSILYSIGSKPLQIWDKKVRNLRFQRQNLVHIAIVTWLATGESESRCTTVIISDNLQLSYDCLVSKHLLNLGDFIYLHVDVCKREVLEKSMFLYKRKWLLPLFVSWCLAWYHMSTKWLHACRWTKSILWVWNVA